MGRISWWCVRGGGAPEPPSPICIVLDVVSFPNFSYTHFVYRPRESSRSTQASIEVGALQSKLAACELAQSKHVACDLHKKKGPFFFLHMFMLESSGICFFTQAAQQKHIRSPSKTFDLGRANESLRWPRQLLPGTASACSSWSVQCVTSFLSSTCYKAGGVMSGRRS